MPLLIDLFSPSPTSLEIETFQVSVWDRWWYHMGGVLVYMCVYLLHVYLLTKYIGLFAVMLKILQIFKYLYNVFEVNAFF